MQRSNAVKRWIFWVGIVAADQVSKWWFVQLDRVVVNRGVTFGWLPGSWWGVGLGLVWFWVFLEWRKSQGSSWWGWGMVVMGGLSNLIDRAIWGGVRDFIYYPWFGLYGNVADFILVMGVGILFLEPMQRMIMKEKNELRSS
jgi:lipoprotein signal peptidase